MRGESVLLVDDLGPRLYAIVIGVLASGGSVVLVEPWMPVSRIERAVELIQPKIFLSNSFGKLWGLRVPAVRKIPHWRSVSLVAKRRPNELRIEQVSAETKGIVTFTSGTTGEPKGVVRTQGYLVEQHRILARHLGLEEHEGNDLCIFANFALANLASGRGSLVMPRKWRPRVFEAIASLQRGKEPVSLTCGPAFLLELMRRPEPFASLKSIHVGGALTDCWIFEEAFQRWPSAHFTHVYGSSEVEPVAFGNARASVSESRARGWFQTLSLGTPAPEIRPDFSEAGLWVSGPHVCPFYLGATGENSLNKRKDAEGVLWHFMGDRVRQDEKGWWYAGRAERSADDFYLEQLVYSFLGSSKAMIDRDAKGSVRLLGEGLKGRVREIRGKFSEIREVRDARIFRDDRHRARIDRAKTLRKAGKVLSK